MSTFFSTNKRIVAISSVKPVTVQVNVATMLSFYIVERINQTAIASVQYQVEQTSGRATVVLTAWTSVNLVGITNNTYTFAYTLPTIVAGSAVLLKLKVTDIDGYSSFISFSDIIVVQ